MTTSITGPSVLAPVVQAGSIGRASVVGDRNVVGDGTVVAGPGGVAVGRGGSVVLAAVAGSAVPLPPPNVDLCVGRDRQVAEVVAGWVGGRMVAVVGGPGIGKSTVLGRAIGDDANCLRNLGQVEFRESHNDRARELFGQALPLYQQIRDRYSQAVAHAWLARTTNGERRSKHCAQLDKLAAELNLKGFRESLRAISGC